jgi:hypothetical protein
MPARREGAPVSVTSNVAVQPDAQLAAQGIQLSDVNCAEALRIGVEPVFRAQRVAVLHLPQAGHRQLECVAQRIAEIGQSIELMDSADTDGSCAPAPVSLCADGDTAPLSPSAARLHMTTADLVTKVTPVAAWSGGDIADQPATLAALTARLR